ncbi:hypothetical protein [Nitrobacter sp.]|uniref:hypothetical protein n=1 Tax=Nitrobacter sp. TaxID=29420 RepID=UPI0029CAB261|nr:hypothetical protein [Nitrobacter sp.]
MMIETVSRTRRNAKWPRRHSFEFFAPVQACMDAARRADTGAFPTGVGGALAMGADAR